MGRLGAITRFGSPGSPREPAGPGSAGPPPGAHRFRPGPALAASLRRTAGLVATILLLAMLAPSALSCGPSGFPALLWTATPPGDQDPTAVQPGAQVSPAERQEIESFIADHDATFCRADLDSLLEFYSERFCSDAYVAVFDRSLMRRTYERLLKGHDDVSLKPFIPRLQKIGSYFAACVCQEFSGRSSETGRQDTDHWCQLYVLEKHEPGLRIVRLYEYDHDYLPHVTRAGEIYRNADLMFSLALPADHLLIQQPYTRRYMDRLRLIGGTLETELSVGLMVNDDGESLTKRVERDRHFLASSATSFRQIGSPSTFESPGPLRGLLVETELEVTPDCALARRTLSRGRIRLSRLYLTSDDRALFVLTLKGPIDQGPSHRDELLGLAQTLRLSCEDPGRYWATLARDAGWGEIDDQGHYRNRRLGLALELPEDWAAEILPVKKAGSAIIKMMPSSGRAQVLLVGRFSRDTNPAMPLAQRVDKLLELPQWAPALKSDVRRVTHIDTIGDVIDAARVFQDPGCDEQRADTFFFRHGETFARITLYTSTEAERTAWRPTLEACIRSIVLSPPQGD